MIENSKYSQVVLQDQSFQPLPTTITVNGQSVATRGNPTSFNSGVTSLVNDIDTADTTGGKPNAAIMLYETPPIASYGYTSSNPNAPIFGSSTVAATAARRPTRPMSAIANPIAAMASDLHNAYQNAASTYNTGNPTQSHVNVALAGDAWVSAINLGFAQQNPFLTSEPAGQVDLWDSNPLLACCTVPIGYHPSAYGDYLDALVLFGQITGVNPLTLVSEFDPAQCGIRGFGGGGAGDFGTDCLRSCGGRGRYAAERRSSAGACFAARGGFGRAGARAAAMAGTIDDAQLCANRLAGRLFVPLLPAKAGIIDGRHRFRWPTRHSVKSSASHPCIFLRNGLNPVGRRSSDISLE